MSGTARKDIQLALRDFALAMERQLPGFTMVHVVDSTAALQAWLPRLALGDLRLQAFGVTEPGAGSDTTRIETFAERQGDHYVINGRKKYISRVLQSDLLLLLARTSPRPRDPARRGCQISLVVHDRPRELLAALEAAGVVCDFREPNVLRVAPAPLYNTHHDVWTFADVLGRS